MKITETTNNHKTGETYTFVWANEANDLDAVEVVANILNHQRKRESGELHPIHSHSTTVSIHIEL